MALRFFSLTLLETRTGFKLPHVLHACRWELQLDHILCRGEGAWAATQYNVKLSTQSFATSLRPPQGSVPTDSGLEPTGGGGGAHSLYLETVILKLHGLVDREGREVVDECSAFLGGDLFFVVSGG